MSLSPRSNRQESDDYRMRYYEIGRFYNVMTVIGSLSGIKNAWPVIGGKHEDSEIIDFPHFHYHIDWRFVSQRKLSLSLASLFAERRLFDRERLYGLILHEGSVNSDLPEPVIRRRKFRGDFEEIIGVYPPAPWKRQLQIAYQDYRLKKDMICPHRGLSLKSCQIINDVVTCPGHGLCWNVKTGKLIGW